jgi:hypothetical protein
MNIITKAVLISKTGLFDEYATLIEIGDLGGGEFVRITQPCVLDGEGISIDPSEWSVIRAQIDKMFDDIERRDGDIGSPQ